MERGKKSVAERVVYDAFEEIKKATNQDPLEVFEAALANVGPTMEVRSRRVGGANYQVPYEVRPERKHALAMRWILGAAKSKRGKPMHQHLAQELIAASKEEGEAIKKKETTHSMAQANKAFAHFAFTGSRKKKTA
jgi:small subunit ribosomal protein S7